MNTADRILVLMDARQVPAKSVRRELATLCKISVQAVGDWFTGKTKRISPEYLALIASRYKTTVDWLITGKGNMNSERSVRDVSHEEASSDNDVKKAIQTLLSADPERLDAFDVLDVQEFLAALKRRRSARFAQLPDEDAE